MPVKYFGITKLFLDQINFENHFSTMTEHFERQAERQKKRTDEDYDEGTIDDFFLI